MVRGQVCGCCTHCTGEKSVKGCFDDPAAMGILQEYQEVDRTKGKWRFVMDGNWGRRVDEASSLDIYDRLTRQE